MKQVLIYAGQHNQTVGTVFATFQSSGPAGATENTREFVVPCDGTCRNLYYDGSASPVGTNVYTIRKNGSDTSLTVTASAGVTATSDTSNSFSVVAGDRICIKIVGSGALANLAAISLSMEFEPTTDARYMMGGNCSIAVDSARYSPLNGLASSAFNASELTGGRTLIPHNGTIRALYIDLTAAPGTGKTRVFVLRKLTTDQASSSITISDLATTGNVTGLSIAVAPGDVFALKVTGTGTAANANVRWGVLFEPTTNGESIVALGGPTLFTSAVSWDPFYSTATTSEANSHAWVRPTDYVFKNLYVLLGTAPGGVTSRTIDLRKNDSSSPLTVTITGAATTGNDTSSASYTAGNTFTIKQSSVSGSPTSTEINASVVMYIAPVVVSIPNEIVQQNFSISRASRY